MKDKETNPGRWEALVAKHSVQVLYWAFAWVLSFVLLVIGSQLIWNFNTSITVLVVFANLAIGIGMIVALIRQMKVMDEMQQRVMLETAALTLGVTLVFAGSFQLWSRIHLVTFEPQVWHVIIFMSLFYMAVTFTSVLRHR